MPKTIERKKKLTIEDYNKWKVELGEIDLKSWDEKKLNDNATKLMDFKHSFEDAVLKKSQKFHKVLSAKITEYLTNKIDKELSDNLDKVHNKNDEITVLTDTLKMLPTIPPFFTALKILEIADITTEISVKKQYPWNTATRKVTLQEGFINYVQHFYSEALKLNGQDSKKIIPLLENTCTLVNDIYDSAALKLALKKVNLKSEFSKSLQEKINDLLKNFNVNSDLDIKYAIEIIKSFKKIDGGIAAEILNQIKLNLKTLLKEQLTNNPTSNGLKEFKSLTELSNVLDYGTTDNKFYKSIMDFLVTKLEQSKDSEVQDVIAIGSNLLRQKPLNFVKTYQEQINKILQVIQNSLVGATQDSTEIQLKLSNIEAIIKFLGARSDLVGLNKLSTNNDLKAKAEEIIETIKLSLKEGLTKESLNLNSVKSCLNILEGTLDQSKIAEIVYKILGIKDDRNPGSKTIILYLSKILLEKHDIPVKIIINYNEGNREEKEETPFNLKWQQVSGIESYKTTKDIYKLLFTLYNNSQSKHNSRNFLELSAMSSKPSEKNLNNEFAKVTTYGFDGTTTQVQVVRVKEGPPQNYGYPYIFSFNDTKRIGDPNLTQDCLSSYCQKNLNENNQTMKVVKLIDNNTILKYTIFDRTALFVPEALSFNDRDLMELAGVG